MISRRLSKEIRELLDFFPAVGITGPRQVGKTTLAKKLMKETEKETVYLDLELSSDLAKLEEAELYLKAHQDKTVILDEVQRKPDLFPVLRALIDQNRVPGRFILLGSASPELIRDSSESLAGRIAYEELTPLTLDEITGQVDLLQHWMRGGFPDALLAPKDKYSLLWRQNFIQTYVERDLPLLGFPADPQFSRRMLTMLAHFHGNVWNASSFAKSLGINNKTVQKYLNFFEQAYLVRQLPPFYVNLKKRLVKSPKIYLRDSGLLHYLVGIEDDEALYGNALLGASWEGYVIEQIAARLEKGEVYFYRTHDGTECDLVIARSGKPVQAIEIKYTVKPKVSRGYKSVIKDLGTEQNFIITPEGEEYQAAENVQVCSLADYLEKYVNQ